MRPTLIAGACLVVALTGCGGSDETLTCQWLAGPDNCWSNTALMAATSCLPAASDSGTFDSGNNSCSYPNLSAIIQFTPALVLPLPDDPEWHFSVYPPAGGACLTYDETASGIELKVGEQTVSESFSGFAMTIACPDGAKVTTSNALKLLDCPAGLTALPGHFVGYTDTSVSFALVGISTGTSLPVFDCAK